MKLGSWESYEMVLRYTHLTPEQLANAAAGIEHRFENVVSITTIQIEKAYVKT